MVASENLSASGASQPATASPVLVRVRWAVISLSTVCLLWAGMLIAIVFEAWVRLQVPSLTRAERMDVGRVVFSAFSCVEIALAVAALILLFVFRPFSHLPKLITALVVLCAAIVAVQYIFLLPLLVERAQMIMAGQEPPRSPAHGLYSVTSLLKLGSLITCGILSIKSLITPER